jgi:hypothetical protein
VIGFLGHTDPGPMLMVLPKDDAAKGFSKERLAPMIETTPVLRELMGDQHTRRSENTVTFKKFPGGFLALAGAGSPTNLSMRPVRVTLRRLQSLAAGDSSTSIRTRFDHGEGSSGTGSAATVSRHPCGIGGFVTKPTAEDGGGRADATALNIAEILSSSCAAGSARG